MEDGHGACPRANADVSNLNQTSTLLAPGKLKILNVALPSQRIGLASQSSDMDESLR